MSKNEIIKRFQEKVYGKKADSSKMNVKHDGKDGHWLEQQMGIAANRNNAPDIFGYEMKNDTTSKTTFGDWSADEYLFNNINYNVSREEFLNIFGQPNVKKDNRPSWSGKAIPNIHNRSSYNGSAMYVNDNSIDIIYDFDQDPRVNKCDLVPNKLQRNDVLLASWRLDSLKEKLISKFGQSGWFRCKKDSSGVYNLIEFGEPMSFENWIKLVEEGIVFFDSGMYQGNNRNYSQWRANNAYWDSLITESYPPFPEED